MVMRMAQLQKSLALYLASPKSFFSRYGISFLVTVVSCYLVNIIYQIENIQVTSLILGSTIFAAAHGGLGPALLSTVIGTVFIEIELLDASTFWPGTIAAYVREVIYLCVSVGVSFLVNLLRKSYMTEETLHHNAELVNREKDSIYSLVAHDLRNPISSAISAIDLLLDPRHAMDTSEQSQFLKIAQRSCRQSLDMIHDVQEYATMGRYQDNLKRQDIDLVPEIRSIAAAMGVKAKLKQINLGVQIPFSSLTVSTDVKLFARVLQNILDNAVKYSPIGSRVSLSCRHIAKAGVVEIEVEDEGPGIPPGAEEKIFEPFYRTHNKPTGGETSTGLGLSSVKTIASLLGITISVRSNGLSGSTFLLRVPVGAETIKNPEKQVSTLEFGVSSRVI